MKRITTLLSTVVITASLWSVPALADSYNDAVVNFKLAEKAEPFFDDAYGYALFPTIGKGAFIVGGAYGKGRVYEESKHIGDSTMKQISVGFSFGGEGYSEIIFFKSKRALDNFTESNFEFNAQTSAVAVNLGANAQFGSTGNSASAGQSGANQSASASYVNDMAVFTITKGGLILDASVAGQQFTYEALESTGEKEAVKAEPAEKVKQVEEVKAEEIKKEGNGQLTQDEINAIDSDGTVTGQDEVNNILNSAVPATGEVAS